MKFFTIEELGPKQSLTPEGFLLCEDVPIARTGTMIYGKDEVPVTPNADGLVRVRRDEDDVFAPKYMASLNGKSVVIQHPDEDVNPENWKQYTVGVVLNPRRGTGAQADLLLCDLLITDRDGIHLIRTDRLREVSAGYQADYDEIAPGEGRQYNFIANHVALVEAGRCGSRCSISDHLPSSLGESAMRTNDKSLSPRRIKIRDEIMRSWKAKDEAAMEKAVDEMMTGDEEAEGEHMHIHLPGTSTGDSITRDEFEAHQAKNDMEHQQMRDSIAELHSKFGKTGDAEEEEKKKAEDKRMRDEEEEKKKAEDKTRDSEAEKEIEGELKEEAPEATGDCLVNSKDSAFLADSFQDTVSMAEILVPGIQVPTYDKAAKPKATFDNICGLRRRALDSFTATRDGRDIVGQVYGRVPDVSKMTCGAVRTLFRGAAALKKVANASGQHRTGDITTAGVQVKGKIASLADLNKTMNEHYGKQTQAA